MEYTRVTRALSDSKMEFESAANRPKLLAKANRTVKEVISHSEICLSRESKVF